MSGTEKWDQAIEMVLDGRWLQGNWYIREDENGEPEAMCLGGLMLWLTHQDTTNTSTMSLGELPECWAIAKVIREHFPERLDASCWPEEEEDCEIDPSECRMADGSTIVVFNDYGDTTSDDVLMVLKLAKEDVELALAEEVERLARNG